MRRTRLEEAWACWLPGSAGGPRLNMPSFSVRSVCCVVSHGRHDLDLSLVVPTPVAHTDSVAAGHAAGSEG